MEAFMDRVNARLPARQPDIVLLALVQNHRAGACGAPCPAGQARGDKDGCLPNALIARALIARVAKRKAPPDSRSIAPPLAVARTATVIAPPDGRMSLAGPALPPAAKHGRAAWQRRAERSAYRAARRGDRRQRARRIGAYGGYPTWAARAFSVVH
jgi:hypothetical protein